MAVTRAQLDAGITYQQFKESMTRNREELERNERDLQPGPDDLAAFRALPRPVHVLAIAEDWCADVVANLPILGRIAQEAGTLDVRILPRDQSPGSEVMDQYLKEGKYRAIPVFVFLDQQLRELAVWQERPASVTERREALRREIYAAHPEFGSPDAPIAQLPENVRTQVQQAIRAMRRDTQAWANAEVVRELRAIAERIAAGAVTAG